MNGVKIDMNNGFLYEYQSKNDIFIEYEIIIRHIYGVDYQVSIHTGKTYTSEQLNQKYE